MAGGGGGGGGGDDGTHGEYSDCNTKDGSDKQHPRTRHPNPIPLGVRVCVTPCVSCVSWSQDSKVENTDFYILILCGVCTEIC